MQIGLHSLIDEELSAYVDESCAFYVARAMMAFPHVRAVSPEAALTRPVVRQAVQRQTLVATLLIRPRTLPTGHTWPQ